MNKGGKFMLENITIDNIFSKTSKWFTKDRKIIFIVTFVIGLLVHFTLYSNELLAYDAYWHYGSFLAKGWEISLGRFLIPFSDILRGSVVCSILTTTISLIIISFSAIFLNEALHIKKNYLKILTSILIVVTPTLSLTLMYPYTANGYTFAMLFAILSIYFINKDKNFKNIIFTLICIIATLAFYQAYLCVITALLLVSYLFKLIDDKLTYKELLKKLFLDIVIIAIGMILYYVSLNIIIAILGLNITSYSSGNTIFSLETIKNILPSIQNTYTTFASFYFSDNILNNTGWYRHIFYAILFVLILLNFIVIIINRKIYKTPAKVIFLLLGILLFPIFACSIELIAQSRNINLLMATSLYLPIVVLIKQIESMQNSKFNNIIQILSYFISVLIIWTFILSNNATYISTKLYNDQMFAVGNRILERIEDNNEITDNTPIVVLGHLDFSIQNDSLLDLTNFDVSDVNIWTWQIFLQDHLGIGRDICTMEDYSELMNSEEYINMPIYPNEGCIKLINGIAVVKLNY